MIFETDRERGREEERNTDSLFHVLMHSLVASCMYPDRDGTATLAYQDDALTNRASPGHSRFSFLKKEVARLGPQPVHLLPMPRAPVPTPSCVAKMSSPTETERDPGSLIPVFQGYLQRTVTAMCSTRLRSQHSRVQNRLPSQRTRRTPVSLTA